MAYYDALVAKWATLTGTTAEKLAAVNALTVAGPNIDVPASEVIGYLALNGKLSALQAYAASPPSGATAGAVTAAKELIALFSLPTFATFQMSNSIVYGGVSQFLGALASDPASGVTSQDEASLLAMAATALPWWQSAGYTSPINENDLAAAGGLA